jgi:hypothetical protein
MSIAPRDSFRLADARRLKHVTIVVRHGFFYLHRVIPAQAGIHAQGQSQAKSVWIHADVDSGLRRNDTERRDGPSKCETLLERSIMQQAHIRHVPG